MQTYLNQTQVPLSVAAYLASDFYDHIPGTISATGLMKPVRQQVLSARVAAEDAQIDITSVVKSRIGTSIHDGVEKVWTGGHYKRAMRSLGYPEKIIERVQVNPGYKMDEMSGQLRPIEGFVLDPQAIPVYMEIRSFRDIAGKRVSGKFDLVAEGRLEDFKSTSTYTWIKGTKDEDYPLQGSIYKWLNPDLITQDVMAIQFFFMDFMAGKAKADPSYPQKQVMQKVFPLWPVEETEQWVLRKLALFDQFKKAEEKDLPECTDKELWRKDPQFKYYKNPAKTTRSTKNFDTIEEANIRLVADGSVGIVKTVPGTVMACNYCAAASVCGQRLRLIADGSLAVD